MAEKGILPSRVHSSLYGSCLTSIPSTWGSCGRCVLGLVWTRAHISISLAGHSSACHTWSITTLPPGTARRPELPFLTVWHHFVSWSWGHPSTTTHIISLSFSRLWERNLQWCFILSTKGVFGQKPMYLRKKQNSSVCNCYHHIDKGKLKSGSAIFSLLNKEIINAFQI